MIDPGYVQHLIASLDDLAAAEARSETLSIDWWHNDHEPQDVVDDIDAMILATPDLPLLNLVALSIFEVAENALPAIVAGELPLHQLPERYRWRGTRQVWFAEARADLLATFPTFGDGLLVAANILARARPVALFCPATTS